jgi:death on curing protein
VCAGERDLGLLDAAAARPRPTALGDHAHRTHRLEAAALLPSIVAHHPLVDGNERLGWVATTIFLDINGATLAISDDNAFDLVLAVAEGRHDVEGIAERLTTSRTIPGA